MLEEKVHIAFRDLKDIIKSLKMTSFAQVEPDALTRITSMIKSLPEPETLDRIAGSDPKIITSIQKDVGGIMRLIELYSRRDKGQKDRYRVKTNGLVPRYKVLDGRPEMTTKADMIRNLVKISSVADNKGNGVIAGNLIKCAKKIQNDEASIYDIEAVVMSLKEAGFESEAQLIKEAGIWDGIKDVGKWVGKGVGQAAKQVGQAAQQAGQWAGQKYQAGKEVFQIGNYNGSLNKINEQIKKTLEGVVKAYGAAQDPTRKQSLGNITTMLQNMLTVGSQVYNLIMEEDKVEQASQNIQGEQASKAPVENPTEVLPPTQQNANTGMVPSVNWMSPTSTGSSRSR